MKCRKCENEIDPNTDLLKCEDSIWVIRDGKKIKEWNDITVFKCPACGWNHIESLAAWEKEWNKLPSNF